VASRALVVDDGRFPGIEIPGYMPVPLRGQGQQHPCRTVLTSSLSGSALDRLPACPTGRSISSWVLAVQYGSRMR